MAQSSKFYDNCGCFLICTPHKTRMFTVRLAVTTKYQGNGFAAEVLLGRDHPRVVRGVISNIVNMMGCDHQSCVPVGPFGLKTPTTAECSMRRC